MIVWVDLETTGLIASQERVLEIAAIITDDALVEVARFQRVTTEARHCDLSKVDPFVLAMHAKNGLWNESLTAVESAQVTTTVRLNGAQIVDEVTAPEQDIYRYSRHWPVDEDHPRSVVVTRPGSSLAFVDADLCAFIKAHCPETGEKKGPQLGGSTISFDRTFMAAHLPLAHSCLHYRNVDVSTLNEIAKRFWPKVFENRPRSSPEAKHRAMEDVVDSLEVARYYVRELGPLVPVANVVGIGNVVDVQTAQS